MQSKVGHLINAFAATLQPMGVRAPRLRDYPTLAPSDPENYVILGELARGDLGRVLKARDRRLGRLVAIKEILPDTLEVAGAFDREIRITSRLEHPAIPSVHEAGRWPTGQLFYAMKLASGRPLDLAIAEARNLADRLALLPAFLTACEAVAYAHSRGIVHSDLGPDHILVGSFGETLVIDWARARDLTNTGDQGETTASDTPAYVAPEIAMGAPGDERADVYALGATLYQLLSGRAPYRGNTPREILAKVLVSPPPSLSNLTVPGELVLITQRAMSRAPEDRHPTAQSLAEDLRRFQLRRLLSAAS